MTYNANDIAKYIVQLADGDGEKITHLKLQKLLYYVQGAYLSLRGHPAFDENIFAWKLGPVVNSVYQANSKYGRNSIPPDETEVPFSEIDKDFIKAVYDRYKRYTAIELKDKTHNEAPYKNVKKNDVITQESIKDFFSTEVYRQGDLFSGVSEIDALPTEDYSPTEDAEWEAYL